VFFCGSSFSFGHCVVHPSSICGLSGCRGEDFYKSANQKQELPVAAMFVNGSGQNVQALERTFYRYFLPSFSSFG
jgi:hypothetical protein